MMAYAAKWLMQRDEYTYFPAVLSK